MKHLKINLTKEVKDLYTENQKTQLLEIKEDSNNGKDTQRSWAKDNFLRCQYYSKQSTE